MQLDPLISICIPAYKRVEYLKRLLDSIFIQTYPNFEVIITDDSGVDDSVEKYITSSTFQFKVIYKKNKVPLGSPLNWVESFKHANGDWIKIMHDDDSFTTKNSLSSFVNAIDDKVDCVFSGYILKNESSNKSIDFTLSNNSFKYFLNNPLHLFSKNVIGPPSAMLFKRGVIETFDTRLKWIVDWEFYIRLALKYNLKYINKPLIIFSSNETQITKSCVLNPSIEIPEIMIFYSKYRDVLFKDIVLFDAWWRLIRNLKIKNIKDFTSYTTIVIPKSIERIISFQSIMPFQLLNMGIISKIYMTCCYLYDRVFNL